MKKILCGLSLFAAFSLSSCIQNEPANSECDIEEAYVLASDEEALFFTPNDAVKDQWTLLRVVRKIGTRQRRPPMGYRQPGLRHQPFVSQTRRVPYDTVDKGCHKRTIRQARNV